MEHGRHNCIYDGNSHGGVQQEAHAADGGIPRGKMLQLFLILLYAGDKGVLRGRASDMLYGNGGEYQSIRQPEGGSV